MNELYNARLGRFLFLFNTKGLTIKPTKNNNVFIRILCISLSLLYLTELLLPADYFHNLYVVDLGKSIKSTIIVLSSISMIINTFNKKRIALAFYGYYAMVLVFIADILVEILIIFKFKTMIFNYIFLIQFCLFLFKLLAIKLNIIWYVFSYTKSVLEYGIKEDLITNQAENNKINDAFLIDKTELKATSKH